VILLWKGTSARVAPLWKGRGCNVPVIPRFPASLLISKAIIAETLVLPQRQSLTQDNISPRSLYHLITVTSQYSYELPVITTQTVYA